MWAYVLRKLLYNIPVYLGIVLIVMAALRINDPVWIYLGKTRGAAEAEQRHATMSREMGLDRPFAVQYGTFLKQVVTLDFGNTYSWDRSTEKVGDMLRKAVVPTLSITIPERSLRFTFALILVLSGIRLVEVPHSTLIIVVSLVATFVALAVYVGRQSRGMYA